jgi:hypothetical protein
MPLNRDQTIKKYLKPPSIQLILKVVKDAGVKATQFELYFGIPKGTIKQIKHGSRSMPVRFWELFYEWSENKKKTKKVTKKVTKTQPLAGVSDRLEALLK